MTDLATAETPTRRIIDAMAAFHRLPRFAYRGEDFSPGELLEALIITESSGRPTARRYEPHQDRAGRADAATDGDAPGVDNGDTEDDASWGWTQVMGYNWRRLLGVPEGTPINFAKFALDPVFSLRAGIAVFTEEFNRLYRQDPRMPEPERVVRALCRYNGGPTGDAIDPDTKDIRRREYVDRILKNARLVRESRTLNGWRTV